MKKLYTFIGAALLSAGAYAQCTVNQSVFNGPNDYRILPDTVTNLPLATVGVPYSTDLQFHVDPDTVAFNFTHPITQVTIDSVVGLPAGFTYGSNPTNGIFPGGSYGCIGLNGSPAPGQENGGPLSNGVYPIIVYYSAIVNVFNITPTTYPAVKTGYKLIIQAANGVEQLDITRFSVAQNMPNPSDAKTEFRFNVPNGGNVEFTLYNILGSEVKKETIQAERGVNRKTLETATMPAGVYLYSFRIGNDVITRRMTITH